MNEQEEILNRYGDAIAFGELLSPQELFTHIIKGFPFDTYIDYYRETMKGMKGFFFRSKTGHLSYIEEAYIFFTGPASTPWTVGVAEKGSNRHLIEIKIDQDTGKATREMYDRIKSQLKSKYNIQS